MRERRLRNSSPFRYPSWPGVQPVWWQDVIRGHQNWCDQRASELAAREQISSAQRSDRQASAGAVQGTGQSPGRGGSSHSAGWVNTLSSFWEERGIPLPQQSSCPESPFLRAEEHRLTPETQRGGGTISWIPWPSTPLCRELHCCAFFLLFCFHILDQRNLLFLLLGSWLSGDASSFRSMSASI